MLWSLPGDPDVKPYFRIWGNRYCYHDTPDGQDLFKKLGSITRNTASLGAFWGFLYAKEVLGCKGILITAVETFRVAYPPVLAGATFALVSHNLVQFQGKSGHHNYALSGFAAGAIWSMAYRQQFWNGVGNGLLFAITAVLWYQFRVIEGIKLIPDTLLNIKRDDGYPMTRETTDWTLSKDVPKRHW